MTVSTWSTSGGTCAHLCQYNTLWGLRLYFPKLWSTSLKSDNPGGTCWPSKEGLMWTRCRVWSHGESSGVDSLGILYSLWALIFPSANEKNDTSYVVLLWSNRLQHKKCDKGTKEIFFICGKAGMSPRGCKYVHGEAVEFCLGRRKRGRGSNT